MGMKVLVAESVNADGSSSLSSSSSSSSTSTPYALFTYRGACRFETKSQNAQDAGADLLIIGNMNDDALQRVGAGKEAHGLLGVPSILVTMTAAKAIEEFLQLPGPVTIELIFNTNDKLSKAWIDLAFTAFNDMEVQDEILTLDGLIESHAEVGSNDITSWLERKKRKLQLKNVKTVSSS